jgi:formamidopyrimidine-DNA glycosylase
MPELPEAETIVRGLRPAVMGATITGVRILHPDLVEAEPAVLARGLAEVRILDVGRRGKNVVLHLDGGDRLVVNLGMSGRLLWRPSGDPSPPPSHPGVVFRLHGVPSLPEAQGEENPGGDLVYHDPRRFGRLRLLSRKAYVAWSRTLGPEPLSRQFTGQWLATELARSRSPLRSWLLDQRRVAGVGNIYASEACHLARLHPALPASEVDPAGARRLHRAIRRVLEAAVEGGGTTLRDYRTAQGWEGAYQHRLRVYGREGDPCPRCGREIRRIVFSNRSAFYCPRCQPELPLPA